MILEWKILIVFMKIWRMALAVFLIFYVTLLMFPGLIVGIKSQYKLIENDAWMPVILTVMHLCICVILSLTNIIYMK